MMTTKKLWIGIAVLLLFVPLGVILPRLFGAEGAWGEWGLDGIRNLTGFVPEGMKRLAGIWKPPLPGYGVPGQSAGLCEASVGYVLTGIIGVCITAGLMYVLTKLLLKKNGS